MHSVKITLHKIIYTPTLLLPGKLANLGGTFNNNLESYTGVTAPTVLCDYKIFGGSKKAVIGFSPSLGSFNNRAESAF